MSSAPLELRLVISAVTDAGTCQALAGAQVDASTSSRHSSISTTRFREGGTKLVLPVVANRDGYAATFRIAMRPGEPAARDQ